MAERALSHECLERFEAWVRVHCPCASEDPKQEFLRGLLFICEEAVREAVGRERAELCRRHRAGGSRN